MAMLLEIKWIKGVVPTVPGFYFIKDQSNSLSAVEVLPGELYYITGHSTPWRKEDFNLNDIIFSDLIKIKD